MARHCRARDGTLFFLFRIPVSVLLCARPAFTTKYTISFLKTHLHGILLRIFCRLSFCFWAACLMRHDNHTNHKHTQDKRGGNVVRCFTHLRLLPSPLSRPCKVSPRSTAGLLSMAGYIAHGCERRHWQAQGSALQPVFPPPLSCGFTLRSMYHFAFFNLVCIFCPSPLSYKWLCRVQGVGARLGWASCSFFRNKGERKKEIRVSFCAWYPHPPAEISLPFLHFFKSFFSFSACLPPYIELLFFWKPFEYSNVFKVRPCIHVLNAWPCIFHPP